MGSIRQLCKIGILLHQGQISFSGDIEQVISQYLSSESNNQLYQSSKQSSKDVFVKTLKILNCDQKPCGQFQHTEEILIDININTAEKNPETFLLVSVTDQLNRKIFSAETPISEKVTLKIHSHFLTRGHYSIQTIIYRPAIMVYEQLEKICNFDVIDAGSQFARLETFDYGCVFGAYDWITE